LIFAFPGKASKSYYYPEVEHFNSLIKGDLLNILLEYWKFQITIPKYQTNNNDLNSKFQMLWSLNIGIWDFTQARRINIDKSRDELSQIIIKLSHGGSYGRGRFDQHRSCKDKTSL
jgi:hypothetical protein